MERAVCKSIAVICVFVAVGAAAVTTVLRPLPDRLEMVLVAVAAWWQVVCGVIAAAAVWAETRQEAYRDAFDVASLGLTAFFFVQAVVLAGRSLLCRSKTEGDHSDEVVPQGGNEPLLTVPSAPDSAVYSDHSMTPMIGSQEPTRAVNPLQRHTERL
jgi:hypothetical protein